MADPATTATPTDGPSEHATTLGELLPLAFGSLPSVQVHRVLAAATFKDALTSAIVETTGRNPITVLDQHRLMTGFIVETTPDATYYATLMYSQYSETRWAEMDTDGRDERLRTHLHRFDFAWMPLETAFETMIDDPERRTRHDGRLILSLWAQAQREAGFDRDAVTMLLALRLAPGDLALLDLDHHP
jgi:hypothetical protein